MLEGGRVKGAVVIIGEDREDCCWKGIGCGSECLRATVRVSHSSLNS